MGSSERLRPELRPAAHADPRQGNLRIARRNLARYRLLDPIAAHVYVLGVVIVRMTAIVDSPWPQCCCFFALLTLLVSFLFVFKACN